MTALTKMALAAALMCGVSACSASVEQGDKLVQAERIEATSSQSQARTPPVFAKKRAPYATVKPGAAVSLNSLLPKSMTSGSFQTVQLQLQDAYQEGVLSVKIEPSEGLSLFGGNSAKTFNMAAQGPHIWDLDVKADTDGVYFLNVFAEAQGQVRSFSVRLDMGVITQKMLNDSMPAQGELVAGGKIRVLEATETIK